MWNFLFSFIVFLIGVCHIFLVYISSRKVHSKLVVILILMSSSMAIYSFGYSWELLLKNSKHIYLALTCQYFGLSFLSIFWFTFSYKFRTNTYPSLKIYGLLSVIPIFTLYTMATNHFHHQFYTSVGLIFANNFRYLKIDKGVFYYLFVSYTYFILLYMFISLKMSLKRNEFYHKDQIKTIVSGTLVAILCNLIYFSGIVPYKLDPTPFGFLIMSLMCYKAIFDYSFLDLNETTKSLVYNQVNEGVIVIDIHNRIIDFNPKAKATFKWLDNGIIGKKMHEYIEGKYILEKKYDKTFEIQLESEEGLEFFQVSKNPIIQNNQILAYVLIFTDITSTKEKILDLSYLASHDFLTGIMNKMSFFKESEKELERVKRYGGHLSLVMVDIDYFKRVNDNYGHIVGDSVLKRLASEISKNLRTTDIFGRIGGEEFCILLPETDSYNAKLFAEKIRKLVEYVPFYCEKGEFNITISLGISSYDREKSPNKVFEELLATADKALYMSKNAGRNRSSSLE